jgi:YidC/Oxa1 family membrane protein insertase
MDRRTIWAILLMMVIAFIPTFFIKKPARPVAGVVSDTMPAPAAGLPAPPPALVPATVSPFDTAAPAPEEIIDVTTPLARYGVSTRGGRLTEILLTRYQNQVKALKGRPANLVEPSAPLLDLTLVHGADTLRLDRWQFAAEPASLTVGTTPGTLTLSGRQGDVAVKLTYTFSPDDYQVGVRGRVQGLGATGGQLLVGMGKGLEQTEADSVEQHRASSVVTHQAAAERHDFSGLKAGEVTSLAGPFDWVAVKSKYFVAGLIAYDSTGGRISGATIAPRADAGKNPAHAPVTLQMPVTASGDFSYTLYAGPMEYGRLARIGQDFDDVNPYGWPGFRTLIRFFATPVRWLLVWMHESLKLHYGVVLIVFGLLVRVLLWPLNQKAMRASTAMQAIQPQLQAIQSRYKEDPQKLQQEMFKLYKEHNVNPLGGCWPMLLPMPILFALFFVLGNSIELRGVPFLWFPDLSRPDPLYIIPVLSGISMFALSKVGQLGIQHTPQTKAQAQMMLYMMPVMIGFFGFTFASGLNLYWTVSNLASIPQQWLIGKDRMKSMARQIVEVRTKPDATVTRTKPKK